jgi:hypothetical protein
LGHPLGWCVVLRRFGVEIVVLGLWRGCPCWVRRCLLLYACVAMRVHVAHVWVHMYFFFHLHSSRWWCLLLLCSLEQCSTRQTIAKCGKNLLFWLTIVATTNFATMLRYAIAKYVQISIPIQLLFDTFSKLFLLNSKMI